MHRVNAAKKLILAALGGGLVMFLCGAVAHTGFDLESRALRRTEREGAIRDLLAASPLPPGFYQFPAMGDDAAAVAAAWKQGPSGILLVAPVGEEPMGPYQLGGELASDCLAAGLAALALLLQGPAGFARRYAGLLLMAPVGWLSLSLSHHLWYRFPFSFTLDGLVVAGVEWALAGLFMAWILAEPRRATPGSDMPATAG